MAVAEVLMSAPKPVPACVWSHYYTLLACLLQRKECKDLISMYTCSNWSLLKQFPAATTDLEDLAWSPDCACLVVWDTCLTYKLVVHSPEGEMLTSYSAYADALGIKAVQWSPSGQMLAVGSFDQACPAV